MAKEKVMIVVWKWRYFKRQARVVSTKLLIQPEFADVSTQLAGYENILFDEFAVCEHKPDGTAPLVDPSAKIVRTYVENEIGDLSCLTFNFVENLIKYYKKENTEVFVFLHRNDGFGENEVEHIKQLSLADRCFLIGEGRDAIYYRIEHYKGLLGQNGRFYRSISRPGRPSVSIAKEEEKTVDLRYFTKVWSYYKHEFYSKIFELKEDILTHFYGIYPDQEPWSFERLRGKLDEVQTLKLRIASFIENDKLNLTKNEVEQLKIGEIDDKRSYAFDDLKANLKTHKSVDKEYAMVSNMLHSYFFEDATTVNSKISINNLLREIEQSFAHLLEVIKPF